jgi:hypothetical protein
MEIFVFRRLLCGTILIALLVVFLRTDAADPARDLRTDLHSIVLKEAGLEEADLDKGSVNSTRSCDSRRDFAFRQLLEDVRRGLFDRDRFLKEFGAENDRLTKIATKARRLIDLSGGASAEAFHFASTVSFRQGSVRDALRHGAMAVLMAQRRSPYHSNFAFYLTLVGKQREARLFYNRARQLDPNNTATHVGLLALALADPEVKMGDLEDIVADWQSRERDPALRETAAVLHDAFRQRSELTEDPSGPPAAAYSSDDDLRRTLRELFEIPISVEEPPRQPIEPSDFFENPLARFGTNNT